ncbi:glycoside hydrolase family 97 N-terminal domain-containing protein [Streptomyces sp. ME02-8801-2C]|uniref:glycoside hydrolase family 97 protein n=1 Tax=Streptomyces sp. ME02-8801-2C TaxID=3028680 RepID=UPI0029A09CF3|nr:glycoside hydrolase family 97 N-terminal domain-containing protein [Streptomyces sp. ME02-8801-2C]MDX3453859.1 glycoside hydrolase family 97 N-terminal domain-containing protein [Streptomyces sp. ME02-8801-2C]
MEAPASPGNLSRRGILKGAAVTAGGAVLGLGGASAARAADASITATSPDGANRITMSLVGGVLQWSVKRGGATVLNSSALGLVLSNGTALGTGNVSVTNYQHWTKDSTWTPVFGRNATVRDHYQEMRWNLRDGTSGVNFSVQLRAYDTGVALRYVLLDTGSATIADELTTFVFPDSTSVYAARDEAAYSPTAPDAIPLTGTSSTDNGNLSDLPLLVTLGSGPYATLCEASRVNYPRSMVSSVTGAANTLKTYLMKKPARSSGTTQNTSTVTTPFATPWRVLVLGDEAGELIDNAELVLNLAPPCALPDTSWIRPGKVFRCELTTAAGIEGVDFAVARNLQYIEYDAGWYGPEFSTPDATTPIAAIDLPTVIDHATTSGVGVFLYVNRIALTDPDTLFALYKSWGVAGIKLGFINDGTQAMTNQIISWAKAAAKYELLIDMHDDVRSWGYERTYPNWISLEGVRGNEQFPTATNNILLPFARNVGGPMDYTICYGQSRDQTTNNHQLAMAAVYYQPLNFLYWYSKPSAYATTANWPGLAFFDAVPTTWDESTTVAASLGEYVAVARRSGATWFLGAMNNETARTVPVALSFLDSGTSYTATIYADGTAASSPHGTPTVVSTRTVTSATTLNVAMTSAGGQAVILTPVS